MFWTKLQLQLWFWKFPVWYISLCSRPCLFHIKLPLKLWQIQWTLSPIAIQKCNGWKDHHGIKLWIWKLSCRNWGNPWFHSWTKWLRHCWVSCNKEMEASDACTINTCFLAYICPLWDSIFYHLSGWAIVHWGFNCQRQYKGWISTFYLL